MSRSSGITITTTDHIMDGKWVRPRRYMVPAPLVVLAVVAALCAGAVLGSLLVKTGPTCQADQVYVVNTHTCADASDHAAHEGN